MATVSKNITWSSATSLLQMYTGSVVFIVLAKLMSVEDFGILSFGYALSTILWVCADFGLSLMIMKDYPKSKFDHKKYIFNALIFKLLNSIVVGVFALLYLCFLYEGKWVVVGGIYVLFAIVSSYIIFFQALLKVQNKFGKYTQSTVVYALSITLIILIYLLFDLTLIELVLCLLLGKLLQVIWTAYLCKDFIDNRFFDTKTLKYFFKNSWSFGFHMVLGIFYVMIDTQIISFYLGAKYVALYQSVFRIIVILLIVSEMLSGVLLPYLSFKYAKKEKIGELISKIIIYLFIIGCSLFLLFTTFRGFILATLYTEEYLAALPIVLPFSIIVFIRTVCSLLGNILTISNKQAYRVITVLVTLLVNLILNLIFIPEYGIVGAAWISVISHLILFALYYYFSVQVVTEIKMFSKENILLVITAAGIYFSLDYFSIFGGYIVVVGILIWLGCIMIVMGFRNNLGSLKQILKDKGVG